MGKAARNARRNERTVAASAAALPPPDEDTPRNLAYGFSVIPEGLDGATAHRVFDDGIYVRTLLVWRRDRKAVGVLSVDPSTGEGLVVVHPDEHHEETAGLLVAAAEKLGQNNLSSSRADIGHGARYTVAQVHVVLRALQALGPMPSHQDAKVLGYHSTTSVLQPGDMLTPASRSGLPVPDARLAHGDRWERVYFWLASHPEALSSAVNWAYVDLRRYMSGRPSVYLVEAWGDVQPDPEMEPVAAHAPAYLARHARVLGLLWEGDPLDDEVIAQHDDECREVLASIPNGPPGFSAESVGEADLLIARDLFGVAVGAVARSPGCVAWWVDPRRRRSDLGVQIATAGSGMLVPAEMEALGESSAELTP